MYSVNAPLPMHPQGPRDEAIHLLETLSWSFKITL